MYILNWLNEHVNFLYSYESIAFILDFIFVWLTEKISFCIAYGIVLLHLLKFFEIILIKQAIFALQEQFHMLYTSVAIYLQEYASYGNFQWTF